MKMRAAIITAIFGYALVARCQNYRLGQELPRRCRKGSRCAAANCKAIFSTLDVNRVRVRSNNSKDEQVQPEWIVACEISNPPSSSSSSDHSSSDTPPISLHRCGPKFGPSSVPSESGASSLQSALGFVLIFSVPGYIVFAILGFPILYVLHYFKCSAFWVFVVAGLFCTMAPFALNALNERLGHHISGSQIAHNMLGQLLVFGPIGILNGIVTRLIVLGWRSPRTPQAQDENE